MVFFQLLQGSFTEASNSLVSHSVEFAWSMRCSSTGGECPEGEACLLEAIMDAFSRKVAETAELNLSNSKTKQKNSIVRVSRIWLWPLSTVTSV